MFYDVEADENIFQHIRNQGIHYFPTSKQSIIYSSTYWFKTFIYSPTSKQTTSFYDSYKFKTFIILERRRRRYVFSTHTNSRNSFIYDGEADGNLFQLIRIQGTHYFPTSKRTIFYSNSHGFKRTIYFSTSDQTLSYFTSYQFKKSIHITTSNPMIIYSTHTNSRHSLVSDVKPDENPNKSCQFTSSNIFRHRCSR